MPFDRLFPRSFCAAGIDNHAPTAPGVYGISNASEWIFIGETDNIQAALLEHLRGARKSLSGRLATGFVYEVCDLARRPARLDALVREYEPISNRLLQPRVRDQRI